MSSTLQIQINPKIENAYIHIGFSPMTTDDSGNVDADWDERKTNKEGYVAFLQVPPVPQYILVRAHGYKDKYLDAIAMPHDDLIAVDLEEDTASPPAPSLSRLHANSESFKNEQGQTVYIRGVSFFAAYDTFLRGGDLRPALAELQSLGANCVRVFGMSKYVQENLMGRPPFKPQDHGDTYYDKLPEFCDLCAEYGMYVYWSIFPDNGFIMPDSTEQVAHFNRMTSKLNERANNIIELTNEPSAHGFNSVDVGKFNKPSILCNSGSYGDEFGGSLPPWPIWDFGDLHSNRSYPKQVKDNCTLDHPIHVILHKPVLVGEPDRFGSNGNPDPRLAAGSAGGALLSAGYVFHSIQGEKAEKFDDLTLRCAKAAFHALTSV